jgi:hypothetical protein
MNTDTLDSAEEEEPLKYGTGHGITVATSNVGYCEYVRGIIGV